MRGRASSDAHGCRRNPPVQADGTSQGRLWLSDHLLSLPSHPHCPAQTCPKSNRAVHPGPEATVIPATCGRGRPSRPALPPCVRQEELNLYFSSIPSPCSVNTQ
ncbi:Hypothetical predicted protein [Marmota monax]|uniref:Uncharacterized protein n=1 Tax=Marmota monax TaxID=9995 RepID=A0A5E4BF89_MARMO|nr:hypothetical protein GHT09_009658 [Marmota monax]VTJ67640.1 Hypothetical predicted protein [Marmota monax]